MNKFKIVEGTPSEVEDELNNLRKEHLVVVLGVTSIGKKTILGDVSDVESGIVVLCELFPKPED